MKTVCRKVFQRQKTCHADSKDSQMTEDTSSLIKEIESLREQVDCLNAKLNSLKLETEKKEMKLASLAREKEKLSINLAKVRRSNEALAQQLEDERNFYYREKETYCQEMNDYKKLKKALSNSNISKIDNKDEVDKLKKTLEHTLQTNYNLSVKFLRMRETKNLLSSTLNKVEEEHNRIVNDFKAKISHLKDELKEIMNQKFETPLSPSNKKYLQLVNRNSSLVYENLQLQIQIDHLNLQIKRSKIQRTKSETIHHHHRTPSEENKIVKIYEREKRTDTPTVTILNEKEAVRLHSSERKLQLPVVNESKLEVFQVSGIPSQNSVIAIRKRSRSAPKIIQSVAFKYSTPEKKRDVT